MCPKGTRFIVRKYQQQKWLVTRQTALSSAESETRNLRLDSQKKHLHLILCSGTS